LIENEAIRQLTLSVDVERYSFVQFLDSFQVQIYCLAFPTYSEQYMDKMIIIVNTTTNALFFKAVKDS